MHPLSQHFLGLTVAGDIGHKIQTNATIQRQSYIRINGCSSSIGRPETKSLITADGITIGLNLDINQLSFEVS